MPLFEGHKDKGIQRLFIEIPDNAKGSIAYKWPDQQILQHSLVNVDLDYTAVFTNLGKVIGTLGPGRHPLDEGASLTLGWLVDRLTGGAYYDAEVYFITTRDIANQKFGGPVDNLADGPTGLVVSLRVFGELAFKVTDPSALLSRLVGTGQVQSYDPSITTWVEDQALAAIRAVLPDLVQQHGVLAMGQLQDATSAAALAKANQALSAYGLQISTFAQLNVNLPDADAQQLKQLAQAKAYSGVAGDFTTGVRGAAALEIAQGVESGNVGAQQAIISAGFLSTPVSPGGVAPQAGAMTQPAGSGGSAAEGDLAHFCAQCGVALPAGSLFCPRCGTAIAHPGAGTTSANVPERTDPPPPPPATGDQPPAPGYWLASDGRWYPPSEHPGP
jgi:membrane protease subunit (stomatin/prohibitin family)